jgi:hypothetical protein
MDGWEDKIVMKLTFPFLMSNADIRGGNIWEHGDSQF